MLGCSIYQELKLKMIGFQYKPFTLCQQTRYLVLEKWYKTKDLRKFYCSINKKKLASLQLMTIKVIGCINKAKCILAISIFTNFWLTNIFQCEKHFLHYLLIFIKPGDFGFPYSALGHQPTKTIWRSQWTINGLICKSVSGTLKTFIVE